MGAGRGTDILLGGNPATMAKLRVRDALVRHTSHIAEPCTTIPTNVPESCRAVGLGRAEASDLPDDASSLCAPVPMPLCDALNVSRRRRWACRPPVETRRAGCWWWTTRTSSPVTSATRPTHSYSRPSRWGYMGYGDRLGQRSCCIYTVFTLRERAVACLAMCLSDLDHAMPHVFCV